MIFLAIQGLAECQQTGKMDIEEYFEEDERYIKPDLQTYLESKYVVQNVPATSMPWQHVQERRLVPFNI
jgi:hypothetical protein